METAGENFSTAPSHAVTPDDSFVLRCAWCGRFAVGDRWLEAASAISALSLDSARPPLVSHGLCPHCDAALIAEEAQTA